MVFTRFLLLYLTFSCAPRLHDHVINLIIMSTINYVVQWMPKRQPAGRQALEPKQASIRHSVETTLPLVVPTNRLVPIALLNKNVDFALLAVVTTPPRTPK